MALTAPETGKSPTPATEGFLKDLRVGLFYYSFTTLIAVLGVVFGHDLLRPASHPLAKPGDLLDSFATWDGQWYKKIVVEGYIYDPRTPSSVAFFPAYPLLGRIVVMGTGCRPELALLLVSHFSLAATFVLLAAYVRRRFQDAPPDLSRYVLLAFGLLPTTFFCRMAYTESLFLFVTVLALYGIARRWPLLPLAVIIGFATATRSVGVSLLLPLALYIWHESPGRRGRVCRLLIFLPVAVWGIAAYMLYQFWQFDEPLAFAKTQTNWNMHPALPVMDRVLALVAYQPLWSIFDPSSPCFWQRYEPGTNPLFSLHVANPVYFVLAAVLIIMGGCKRWLNRYELALSVALLLIPYVMRSEEMCMSGMARFAAAVFPVYLVLGQLLKRMPAPAAAALLGVSSFLLGVYAALFASWHRFF